jgi:hypothetical protein
MHFAHAVALPNSSSGGRSRFADTMKIEMQLSSLIHAAALAVSLAGVLGAATLAYADAPKADTPQVMTQPAATGTAQQPAAISNTGPYDSPDFVVPENDINS